MSPFDHSFAFARWRAILRTGGTVVFDEGIFNPARALLSTDTATCNAISSVSSGFAILLQQFSEQLAKIGGCIRWCEIGSLPLPVHLKRQMLSVFPSARIFMHYGLTEASRTTFLDLRRDAHKLESVGKPSPNVEVRASREGELLVRGPNVTPGYWRREEEWNRRFVDRWLHTGDLGRLDDDGYVYVLGRKDDVINVGGEKMLPSRVEQALEAHLGDIAYCVLGIPDPDGVLGEIPVLVVEDSTCPSITEIRECLFHQIPQFSIPRQVFHLDAFPRTANGKIQRRFIRDKLLIGNA